ncbi:Type IV secretory system Conjugative DNA transfer [[Clostridium] lactatifermentans DSM 14214]|uniref:Type IV secretory system Conjugative DNA transfer n=2 Tax=Anaerotignum lactatifermentans TaxID=160404 RepID=A0A1M6LB25_9FIRM|nr:type IV secretory system conjugative DNA transfer family protein [Anaerotignum lactatifermentans]SHJ68339.1 Type IV secretory system Conjugative DNA transfer [[Clostridium] lactatifermentans DSM 14214] [Anaerotignum lactatifermentans DSM 14214]
MPNALIKIIPLVLIFGAFMIVMFFLDQKSLNIKSKTVGDGQHGSASFATPKEMDKFFKRVNYTPTAWRINNPESLPQGIIIGCNITKIWKKKKVTAVVDEGDVHALMIGAAGVGKTAKFLYPNIEYCCASGMSFVTSDTKGDLLRSYAPIAKKYYGYDISVLDLRNPTQSDGFNMLHMVNRYMDDYLQTDSLVSKAKAEKYAKIISKTIMNSGGFDSANAGQNAFFYDSAEGLITSVILVISEFCSPYALLPLQRQNKKEAIEKRLKYIENMRNFCIENKVTFLPQKDSARKEAETAEIVILFKPQKENDGEPETHHGEERHIISVFKLIQDLLGPSEVKGKSQFKLLMELLPEEHKARWMSGAALNTSEQAMASVLSTALSRLNAFLDSEIEQLLCFETKINTESFCKQKSAVFLIMPEEDDSKYFLISLIVQQLYREMLSIADEMGGKLPNRVMFFLDEFGTLPAIKSAEMMFSASRSRRISFVPIIQSLAQLEKNYGKEGKDIIIDNCQICIYGGFAPNSEAADVLSKILGERTVMTGSVSQGKDKSKSLQMTGRPLMTADELKVMPKDTFIVTRTGVKPMKTILKLFFEWGIQLNEKYALRQPVVRKVCYADKKEIRSAIIKKYGKTAEFPKLPTSSEPFFNGSKSGLKDIGKNMKSR